VELVGREDGDEDGEKEDSVLEESNQAKGVSIPEFGMHEIAQSTTSTHPSGSSSDNLTSVDKPLDERLDTLASDEDLFGLDQPREHPVAFLLDSRVVASDQGLARCVSEQRLSRLLRKEGHEQDQEIEHCVTRRARLSRSGTAASRLVVRDLESLAEVGNDLGVSRVDVGLARNAKVGGDDLADHASLLSADLGEDVKKDGEKVLGHRLEEGEVLATGGLVEAEGGEELGRRSGGGREGARGLDEGLERAEKGRSKGGLSVEDLGDESSELVGERLLSTKE
jgi:hypothetical protein